MKNWQEKDETETIHVKCPGTGLYYATVKRVCSRCKASIEPDQYFVHRHEPGKGCCWKCVRDATPYERFQLERGQHGLNGWIREQETKRERQVNGGFPGADDP